MDVTTGTVVHSGFQQGFGLFLYMFSVHSGQRGQIELEGDMLFLQGSEMFSVDGDGYIIDTPGIKGFGTFDMEEEEIGAVFPVGKYRFNRWYRTAK